MHNSQKTNISSRNRFIYSKTFFTKIRDNFLLNKSVKILVSFGKITTVNNTLNEEHPLLQNYVFTRFI